MDNLIRVVKKAEARAKIQESTYLDQRCPKRKRPLKMSLNALHDQAKKTKTILSQAKASSLISDQSEVIKKAKEKAKKEMKRRGHQGK